MRVFMFLILASISPLLWAEKPIVIAHRGACGYLPEHTLEAVAMAHAMGVDYIEQDIVISKDNVPVVLHDIHLDTVTDVATRFPDRKRADGRYYAIDFTVAELKSLSVSERFDFKSKEAAFSNRFPVGSTSMKIPTLEDEIQLIQGLNHSTGKNVGIYVEVKSPAWHREEGKDISVITLKVLADHGYTDKSDRAFLQCFEGKETKRVRNELKCQLRIIQLIGENDWGELETDYDEMKTRAGLSEVAKYADGIGPWLPQIVQASDDSYRVSSLVNWAHECGLKVHPYTFRADSLPEYVTSFEKLHRIFFIEAKVDGVFSDFPDRSVQFRNSVLNQ